MPLPNYFYPSKEKNSRLKAIPGFKSYRVTDDGRVISFFHPNHPVVLRTHPNNVGYHIVSLWQANQPARFLVHRLVAEAFVHNPKPQAYDSVHHLDWDKNNNHHTNLIWQPMERILQQAHQAKRWVGNGVRSFSDGQARSILRKWHSLPSKKPRNRSRGSQITQLAEEYGVAYMVIWDLVTRRSYKNVAV